MKSVAVALLAIALLTKTAQAELGCQGDCVPIGEWQFSLSVGLGSRTNPVLGQDDVALYLVPKFSYYGERFFVDSYDIGYTLIDQPSHQVNALLISPGFEQSYFTDWTLTNVGIGDIDDPLQNRIRLHDRDLAGLSGVEYTYTHSNFTWQTQLLQDVSNVHQGQKARTAITLPWKKGRSHWELSFGGTWQSHKLIDYYYGVRADEVIDQRLVYRAPANSSLFVLGQWETRLSKHWGLRAVTSYRWLGTGITDSPLVDEQGSTTAFVAGVYHF
jgi:outer membrane protein